MKMSRWCCLRAVEWIRWPYLISQPIVPVMLLVLASCGFDGQCPNLNLVPMPARIIWIAEDTLVANDYLPEAKMRCDPAISVG